MNKMKKIKNADEENAKQLKKKIKEYENNWKRALADYQNLQKRVEKEKDSFAAYANQRLVRALLSVWDALEKASSQREADAGVKLILKQLDEILTKEGVEKIEVRKGDKFNPGFMEAIETVEKGEKNTVAGVLRGGFKYKDRILRPAEVKVCI